MSDSQPRDVLGWVGPLVIAALFIFVSTEAGTRALGAGLAVGALSGWRQGRIGYGWRGQPPAGFITGWPAKTILLAMTLLGGAVLIWPEAAMGILGWD